MRAAKRTWIHGFILGAAALALAGLGLLRPSESSTSLASAPAATAPRAVVEAVPASLPPQVAAQDVAPERIASAVTTTASASVEPLVPQDQKDGEPYPAKSVDRATLVKLHGAAPLTSTHPNVQPVIEVKDRHAAELMARPGVVGAGVGLDGDGRVAVVVMTKADVPGLPRDLEGHPVLVWQTGTITSRQDVLDADRPEGKGKPGGGGTTTTETPAYRKLQRPVVPLGTSTGLPLKHTTRTVKRGPNTFTQTYLTAGTLGCRVTVGGVPHALTNFHVYSFDGVAPLSPVPANVLQPGTLDGYGVVSESDSLLGTLTAVVRPDPSRQDNKVDAAIAATTLVGSSSLPINAAGDVITPSSTPADADFLGPVEKFGRTTGYTTGTVVVFSGIIAVDYGVGMGVVQFVDQIGISDGTFSAGGDSGSLIVTQAGKNPVGLLFAGGSTSTFANPIRAVLTALNAVIE